MAFIDYYKILGVDKNIPQKDVRKAYLKRTKQFHPDLHPNDPKAKAKFQALNEAYDVINDPEKRKLYDQYDNHVAHGAIATIVPFTAQTHLCAVLCFRFYLKLYL